MKLYDLLKMRCSFEVITVWDKDYDIEVYFYGTKGEEETEDLWDNAMTNLSKLLDVTDFCKCKNGVTVNLSEIIENNIQSLDDADLFISCYIDDIMDDIQAILAGNVSEKWFCQFVDILKSA